MVKQFGKGKQKVVSCNLLPHCTIQFTDKVSLVSKVRVGRGRRKS